MKKRFTNRLAWFMVIVSLVAPVVQAQVTTSGRLTGVITDAQGALIPKAEVVAKNDQTQGLYKTVANEEGSWTIPSIPTGSYTVSISATGFKTTVATQVKVDAGQVATLNTSLE